MSELEILREGLAILGRALPSLNDVVGQYLKELDSAIEGQQVSCPECNSARHTCPGCGTSVEHGKVACPECGAKEYPVQRTTWSRVVAGDQVAAPNGQYYPVVEAADAINKTLVAIEVKSGVINRYKRVPGEGVMVRRGAQGRAMDIFAAAGFDVTALSSTE